MVQAGPEADALCSVSAMAQPEPFKNQERDLDMGMSAQG